MNTPTIEELSAALNAAREALRKAEELASVSHYAAQAIEDTSIPLEVLACLHYLVLHAPEDPRQIIEWMELAEEQTLRLLEINGQILRMYRQAVAEAGDASKIPVM